MATSVYTLITGASGGIGLELAGIFASHGHSLVLAARSIDKMEKIKSGLEEKYGVPVYCFMFDGTRQGAARDLYESVNAAGLTIDILVNNAGFGWKGSFADMPENEILDMINLNIVTLSQLARLFLPGMIERKAGKILNIGSTASFQPGPEVTVYYASKAYVLSFSEALAEELRNTGVSVTALCPGPTNTGFQKRANMDRTVAFNSLFMMNSRKVAETGYRALMKGRPLVIPGLINRTGAFAVRFLPRSIVPRMVRKIHRDI
jgi:uncharacterized protein